MARDRDSTWFDPHQMGQQIRLNRTYPQVQGSVFFSSRTLVSNPLGVSDSLRNQYYRFPALLPIMARKGDPQIAAPVWLKVRGRAGRTRLRWKISDESTRYFAVYRFPADQEATLEDSRFLLTIVSALCNGERLRKRAHYRDRTSQPSVRYQYVVTALNRTHHESSSIRVKMK